VIDKKQSKYLRTLNAIVREFFGKEKNVILKELCLPVKLQPPPAFWPTHGGATARSFENPVGWHEEPQMVVPLCYDLTGVHAVAQRFGIPVVLFTMKDTRLQKEQRTHARVARGSYGDLVAFIKSMAEGRAARRNDRVKAAKTRKIVAMQKEMAALQAGP